MSLVVVVPWVIDAIVSVGKWAELRRECGRTMDPNGVERKTNYFVVQSPARC
jgi:hypothetical protein